MIFKVEFSFLVLLENILYVQLLKQVTYGYEGKNTFGCEPYNPWILTPSVDNLAPFSSTPNGLLWCTGD